MLSLREVPLKNINLQYSLKAGLSVNLAFNSFHGKNILNNVLTNDIKKVYNNNRYITLVIFGGIYAGEQDHERETD